MDPRAHEYLLDILASIIRDVFAENGQRGNDRGRALRVATLNHDTSYERMLASCEIGKMLDSKPKTSAGFSHSSQRGPLTNS